MFKRLGGQERGQSLLETGSENMTLGKGQRWRTRRLLESLSSLCFLSVPALVFSFSAVDILCSFIYMAQYGCCTPTLPCYQFKLPAQTYTRFHFLWRENPTGPSLSQLSLTSPINSGKDGGEDILQWGMTDGERKCTQENESLRWADTPKLSILSMH